MTLTKLIFTFKLNFITVVLTMRSLTTISICFESQLLMMQCRTPFSYVYTVKYNNEKNLICNKEDVRLTYLTIANIKINLKYWNV